MYHVCKNGRGYGINFCCKGVIIGYSYFFISESDAKVKCEELNREFPSETYKEHLSFMSQIASKWFING